MSAPSVPRVPLDDELRICLSCREDDPSGSSAPLACAKVPAAWIAARAGGSAASSG
jgi:hypothetical protein